MARGTSDGLEHLHARVADWVRTCRKNWTSLRPIQTHVINGSRDRSFRTRDCIISAPTAGGKTMAALLPIISICLENKSELGPGYRILYISPLRALINQQTREDGDIASLANHVGYECTPWMSDVAETRKSRSWANPNGILVTTPESIEGRLLRDPIGVARNFKTLQFVIIDELHAYFDAERGVHLRSLLSRLEARLGRSIPRIALSATLGDISDAKAAERNVKVLGRFLRPGATNAPLVVTEVGQRVLTNKDRSLEDYFVLRLHSQLDNFIRPPSTKRQKASLASDANAEAEPALTPGQEAIARAINELFKGFGGIKNGRAQSPMTALVFANSRYEVENYTLFLNALGSDVTLSTKWLEEQNLSATGSDTADAGDEEPGQHETTSSENREEARRERAKSGRRYWSHHGSLKAVLRHHAEKRMTSGSIGCVLVSTTTLDLGIDVGTVENVVQIGAGPNVASLRQRLGRSRRAAQQEGIGTGRHSLPPPCLDLFVRESGDDPKKLGILGGLRLQTFQALAQMSLLRQRVYEVPQPDVLSLSTLTQQILCTIFEYRTEGITRHSLRDILTRSGPFARATQTKLYDSSDETIFDSLLDHLERTNPGPGLVISDPPAKGNRDEADVYLTVLGVRRVERPDIYTAFASPIEFTVVAGSEAIGSIDLRANLAYGDLIALQGQSWMVTNVNRFGRQVHVQPAKGGKAPHFPGDTIPVSGAVVDAMRKLYALDESALLKAASVAQLSSDAKTMLRQGRDTFHAAGLVRKRVIEQDGDVVIFPWRGQRYLQGIIAILRACHISSLMAGPAIVVPGKSKQQVAVAVKERWSKFKTMPAVELVRGFVTAPRGKFDDMLTPIFWRHDFVAAGFSASHFSDIERELMSVTTD